jgi:hypothetical protein
MHAAPSDSESRLRRRIAAIELSLRCFVFSLIGLVPVVGIPFALAAMVRSRQVPKADSSDWNPADRYLSAARRLGPLSFLTTAVFLFLVCAFLPALLRDCGGYSSGPG